MGIVNKILLVWVVKYDINVVGLCLGDGNIVLVILLDVVFGYVGKVEVGLLVLV